MCDRPILIDNPYLGLKRIGLNFLHDTTSLKIPVPCGNCPTCIALRQSYYVQRCQMESLDNHLFMVTLTYCSKRIPKIVVNGRTLYYPDFTDVQKMFKRLRNRGYKFSYMAVSEYGSEKHRPHFHLIVSVPKGERDTYHDIMNLQYRLHDLFLGEWRRNYGSDRKPKYKDLCIYTTTLRGRNFDCHYIDSASSANGESDVAFYVTKYVLKADEWVDRLKSALKLNLEPEKFEEVWKLLKPRMCISKSFGSPKSENVAKHIREGIELSKLHSSEFPFFINPIDGKTFPLAPYYQKKFLKLEDKFHFFYLSRNQSTDDGFVETPEHDLTKVNVSDARLSRIRKDVNNRLNSYDFVYDDEIKNVSAKALEEDIDSIDLPDFLPDDWQNDFVA